VKLELKLRIGLGTVLVDISLTNSLTLFFLTLKDLLKLEIGIISSPCILRKKATIMAFISD
jgi:hypothetical protein